MSSIIGIDFDNTLVCYDDVIRRLALERGLITPDLAGTKKLLRDTIRRATDGETEWQKIQAAIYGPLISEAVLFPDAGKFMEQSLDRGEKLFIVSHKTRFAGYDTTGTDLRQAALQWMRDHAFFAHAGFSEQDVFFESTREGKIQRLTALECTHVIDDLVETFRHGSFPRGVKRILFSPGDVTPELEGILLARSWKEIREICNG